MNAAQKDAINKACDILFEHFPHVLIVTEHEDDDDEDKWHTHSSTKGSNAALIGMAEMAKNIEMNRFESLDQTLDDEEDDDSPQV